MRIEYANSIPVSIFIAGDWLRAEQICRVYCDDIGMCVTVTPTHYIYRNGQEHGVVVGFINYPRFPDEQVRIEAKAIELGHLLREGLSQESFSVQTPTTTTWFSWRDADNLAGTKQEAENVVETLPKNGGNPPTPHNVKV